MLDKVVHDKGGPYNRLTKQIHLQPFTLNEREQMLASKDNEMSRHRTLKCYMTMGGIPLYWNPPNIDASFFAHDAPLKHEFDYLSHHFSGALTTTLSSFPHLPGTRQA